MPGPMQTTQGCRPRGLRLCSSLDLTFLTDPLGPNRTVFLRLDIP
jgi:hypothetical protein